MSIFGKGLLLVDEMQRLDGDQSSKDFDIYVIGGYRYMFVLDLRNALHTPPPYSTFSRFLFFIYIFFL